MSRFLCLAAALALTGCSSNSSNNEGPQEPGKQAVLTEVGGLLQTASGETGRPPRQAADLARFEHGYPLGYKAVQSGEVVVVWGARMAGEGDAESAPTDVIAYEKKAPAEGGWVLLQNGTVKEMTADEFKTARKAGK